MPPPHPKWEGPGDQYLDSHPLEFQRAKYCFQAEHMLGGFTSFLPWASLSPLKLRDPQRSCKSGHCLPTSVHVI